MKKKTKSCCFLWCLSLLVLFTLAAGCTKTPVQSDTLRIGLAVYQQDDTFISTVVQNIERIAREEEAARSIRINITILDGQSNQTVQLEQINRLLEQGCNVLCVNIVDRTAAAALIDNAQSAGVPVIFFNRQPVEEDMTRWEQAYYVGASAAQSGQLQGQIVRSLWQKEGNRVDRNGDGTLQYIMLEGEPGHQDALLRTQYAIQVLTTSNIRVEKLASQTANWKRGEAANLMAGYLAAYGSTVEVVFANNDDMALGAIDAYDEAGVPQSERPVIVGVDALPQALEAIAAGKMQGTVLNDSEGIARAVMDIALAYYDGVSPAEVVKLEEKQYVWLPYQKITAETLAEKKS